MSPRYKTVLFSPELFHEWIIEGAKIPSCSTECVEGIPEDAKFITGDYDVVRHCYVAIYEHPSWPEVMLEDTPVTLMCRFETHYENSREEK